ncbi:CaiB/BaiF CoA transferase family protein [Nocardia carnea]|uniref:CaiB/BaiF CoA transferase family protein n=1 Tax=Nocardia carnea TaxID=37328 RepID=UPI002454DE1F|nr:CoA transferase [Nocardia carnea]
MDRRPLEGTIVLDLTTALAGPYATLLLAGLGARVIKIENPERGGDASRNNSPYVTRDGLSVRRTAEEDMSVSMLARGRNKESITLDLKRPEGREVFFDLVAHADIVVENYSAGVTARLGIDHAAVAAVNPAIVYTSISGFGSQGGPGTGKAMDTIIQALSGVMMTAGNPGDAPIRFGLPIGDLLAPLFAVIGTLSAVIQAGQTGRGQHVDVSMLGALTSLVAAEPFDAFEMIGLPTRTGDMVPRLAPFGVFPAADGHFAICGPTDAFAHGVLKAIGRADLISDPRFAKRDGRVHHADELHAMIAHWAADKPVAEVVAELESQGAPCAEVRSPRDAVRDPIVRQRGEVVPLTHPGYGDVVELFGSGLPITMSDSDTSLDRPAPALGEHNHDVLGELLGYDAARIAALAEGKVL